ncbi:MAG: sigma-70 family RNA polymerase sigma factor, partial [Planctomycetes bacterium]|nr:sigma-70 family RNA polymerase sigma factor [Planctomycetota bacterium]
MTEKAKTEDRALVLRAIKGDKAAFSNLIELYQDRVYNFCYRLTAQEARAWDLSQEAFLRAYTAIRGFKGASSFYTWIYRIVLNLHLNQEQSL